MCLCHLQSLSAAHLLATQHSQSVGPLAKTALLPPSSVEKAVLPPEFQSLLESCSKDEVGQNISSVINMPIPVCAVQQTTLLRLV